MKIPQPEKKEDESTKWRMNQPMVPMKSNNFDIELMDQKIKNVFETKKTPNYKNIELFSSIQNENIETEPNITNSATSIESSKEKKPIYTSTVLNNTTKTTIEPFSKSELDDKLAKEFEGNDVLNDFKSQFGSVYDAMNMIVYSPVLLLNAAVIKIVQLIAGGDNAKTKIKSDTNFIVQYVLNIIKISISMIFAIVFYHYSMNFNWNELEKPAWGQETISTYFPDLLKGASWFYEGYKTLSLLDHGLKTAPYLYFLLLFILFLVIFYSFGNSIFLAWLDSLTFNFTNGLSFQPVWIHIFIVICYTLQFLNFKLTIDNGMAWAQFLSMPFTRMIINLIRMLVSHALAPIFYFCLMQYAVYLLSGLPTGISPLTMYSSMKNEFKNHKIDPNANSLYKFIKWVFFDHFFAVVFGFFFAVSIYDSVSLMKIKSVKTGMIIFNSILLLLCVCFILKFDVPDIEIDKDAIVYIPKTADINQNFIGNIQQSLFGNKNNQSDQTRI